MSESISFVGLDVHKKFIQVAMLRPGDVEPVTWRVPHTAPKVDGLVRRLRQACEGQIELCYEAGPTGYALCRRLEREEGFRCSVIAPSLIPRKPGERVKTDRRDAKKLAHYLKAGLLTEVQPPSPEDEARRELVRARTAAKEDEQRAKHRLSKFLLRQGRTYSGGTTLWTKTYMLWIERQKFGPRHLQTTFDVLLRALCQVQDRIRELDQAVSSAAQDEAVRHPVAFLRCFKGIDTTAAMALVTELYSFERFNSPRSLMAFVGLTPSEHSSAGEPNRGGITKAGNSRLRRLATEVAWHFTRTNKTGRALRTRREGQPGWVVDVAERAQHRLYRRYWALVRRGKHPNKAVTAIAREFLGFVWVVLAKNRVLQEAHA